VPFYTYSIKSVTFVFSLLGNTKKVPVKTIDEDGIEHTEEKTVKPNDISFFATDTQGMVEQEREWSYIDPTTGKGVSGKLLLKGSVTLNSPTQSDVDKNASATAM